MSQSMSKRANIAILGAGPIGLDMAASAIKNGFNVTIIEKGPTIASNVHTWGNVELFSPNQFNSSLVGREILTELNLPIPEHDIFPTAKQLINEYFQPIYEYLKQHNNCIIMTNTEVISVTRSGLSKNKAIGRTNPIRLNSKFNILIREQNETKNEDILSGFDAVIDCTGCLQNPNYMGPDGMPAIGESILRNIYPTPIYTSIPYSNPSHYSTDYQYNNNNSSTSDNNSSDITTTSTPTTTNTSTPTTTPTTPTPTSQSLLTSTTHPIRTVIIGAGSSAITSIKMLQNAAKEHGYLSDVLWITRKLPGQAPYSRYPDDPLPQRDALYRLGNHLAEACSVDVFSTNSTSNSSNTGTTTSSNSSTPTTNAGTSNKLPTEVDQLNSFSYLANMDILRIERLPTTSTPPTTITTTTSTSTEKTPPYRFRLTLSQRCLPDSPQSSSTEQDQTTTSTTTTTLEVHNIISNVGYHPNTDMIKELQVHYCWATEGPMKLAASMMSSSSGSSSDCLQQVSQGGESLHNPESRFFIIGMKSYGRGSAFLMKIGYEQVQLVLQMLLEEFPLKH